MEIKYLQEVDYVNYKKPNMFIGFPKCSFKCGRDVCQNVSLSREPNVDISAKNIVLKYMTNPLSRAIVMGGLEPFDSWDDLLLLIKEFRRYTNDDIVIYTGYWEYELTEKIAKLSGFKNIIVKFGRFVPNEETHFDNVLGINLASKKQYAKKISVQTKG